MAVIKEILDNVSSAVSDALGVSLSNMLIQLGATIILIFVVKYFFWNKITDYLQKRKEIMENNFKEAKEANEEAAKFKEQTHNDYQDLKAKSRGYLEKARAKGEEEKALILANAKEKANNLMELTQREIEAEKTRAKTELQKEVIDLASLMATKIIQEEIDKDKYQDLAVGEIERSEEV